MAQKIPPGHFTKNIEPLGYHDLNGKPAFKLALQEVNRRVELLKQQLEIQKRIVPDEKEAADFIHLLQDKASSSGVEIRRYTAKPIATRDYYSEVPFEIDLDGPYYGVRDFFDRVGRLERIVNISNLPGQTDMSVVTAGYNCRPVGGTDVWSEHAYGVAVDINPLQNPMIRGGSVSPGGGQFTYEWLGNTVLSVDPPGKDLPLFARSAR